MCSGATTSPVGIGGRSSPSVVLHCDHVKPRSKGGETTLGNLVTACSDCNYGKRAKEIGCAPEPCNGSLVGFWGISLVDGLIDEQFEIIQKLDDETYIVQLFEWFFGQASTIESRSRLFLLNPETCKLWTDRSAWIHGKYPYEMHLNRKIDAELAAESDVLM